MPLLHVWLALVLHETRAEGSGCDTCTDAEMLDEVLEASEQTLLQTFMKLHSPGAEPAGESVQEPQRQEGLVKAKSELKRLEEDSQVLPLPAMSFQDTLLEALKACAEMRSWRFWTAVSAVAGLALLIRLVAKRWCFFSDDTKAVKVGTDAWFDHFLEPKRFEPITSAVNVQPHPPKA